MTITDSLFVHCLAATAGEIIIALINITPAACIPIITVITIRTEMRISIFLLGKPKVFANSESNVTILNSFQNKIITINNIIPVYSISLTSRSTKVDA